jgi:glycerate kinase
MSYRILIAVNSFKGSMTSLQAGAAVGRGLDEGLRAIGHSPILDVVPVADGGEGTVEAFRAAVGGERSSVTCRGPLGDPVEAAFLLLPDGRTAAIEMAASCGLTLAKGREAILRSDTTGLGEQIRAALDRGADRLVIGIGGSATQDGGAGMARALGARFLDGAGREIGTTPERLASLAAVDLAGLDPRLRGARIDVLCDVTNPLLGPAGAAAVYAPQKGADPAAVARLEAATRRLADVVEASRGRSFRDLPGAGAAGGLGFGLAAFLGAALRPGIEVVIETAGLRGRAAKADLLATGEGRLDAQSLRGKGPAGIAALAREAGAPCVAFCGSIAGPREALVPAPFAAVYEILPLARSLADAIARGESLLRDLARSRAADVAALRRGGA